MNSSSGDSTLSGGTEPAQPGISQKEILNFEEAAAFLGVSTKTFARVLHTNDIPARKVGREWKFSKTAILAWLAGGSSRDYRDDDDTTEVEAAPRAVTTKAIVAAVNARPPAADAVTRPRIDAFSADVD